MDWQLYGPNAGGHHLTNVLLHAATTLLLFLVLRQMTGRVVAERLGGGAVGDPSPAGGIGGLGDGTERRAQRPVLRAHAWAYASYVRLRFRSPDTWRVMVLFALGLMAKPMLVTLPCVLLLLDYWPLGES